MESRDQLIVFTRYPVPGKAKTRLIPAMGEERAAALQRKMTEHTLRQARRTGAPVEVRWSGGTLEKMRDWLGQDLNYVEQGGGDLGERMARAFQEHFEAGARRVLLIGCDCPANGWMNMCRGFQELETSSCVIGPASDGGYYLIGLSRMMPELFRDIGWGSAQVLAQTISAAPVSPALLPELDDVDLIDDVPPEISVIIPALNEERHLVPTLKRVMDGFLVECIVADGGSGDGAVRSAEQAGAKTVVSAPGRALQMNQGAAEASGDILLFLHADTELPEHWDFEIRAALRDPAVAMGAFRFAVRERLRGIGLVEWGANLRSAWFRAPYGDQGLFLRRELFEKLGGFPEQPILEDLELVRSARRVGRVITLGAAARTSGRRWRKLGIVRTTFRNQLILAGSFLGFPARKLCRLYGRDIGKKHG